jgi:hypothetical protein
MEIGLKKYGYLTLIDADGSHAQFMISITKLKDMFLS